MKQMTLKKVNVNKLHDEFVANGIYPNPVLISENGDGDFTFGNDIDVTLVQSIIDAHDPTPLPPMPSKGDLIEQELANTNTLILELTELIIGGM